MPFSLSPRKFIRRDKNDAGAAGAAPAPTTIGSTGIPDAGASPPASPSRTLPQIITNTVHTPSSESFSIYGSSPSSPRASFSKSPSARSADTKHSRRVSDMIRTTPASLVRHSRVYSASEGFAASDSSLHAQTNGRTSLLLQNKLLTENLPPALVPVVNLLNAQKLRTYAMGTIQVPGVLASGERVWLEVEAKLSGNELALWRPAGDEYDSGNTEFTPKYINLIDAKVDPVPGAPELRVVQDYDNTFVLHFHSQEEHRSWLAAIHLSKYEYTSLNEAYTAVVLSLKTAHLSDVHVLLSSKKRFARSEWCDLRLPQISNRWLRVYVVVTPGESKHLGRIEMFSSEKTTKKNLVVYVSNVANVYNVYPEHSNMIDFNAIMKLNGDIYVNKNYEHYFVNPDGAKGAKAPSRSNSHSSLSSLTPGSPGRARSGSVTSTSSLFNTLDNDNPRRTFSGALSPGRQRSASSCSASASVVDTAEPKRTSSFLKKNMNGFVTTNHLYIMPLSHPGVPAIEIMIRNFIHIIDSFKLYGRPTHLVSEKSDPQSLLFALPSLPHYQYLSIDDAIALVDRHFAVSMAEDWSELQWSHTFRTALLSKYAAGPYKGSGNIAKLYGNLDLDFGEISSPRINIPSFNGDNNSSDGVVSPVDSVPMNLDSRNDFANSSSNPPGYLGAPVDFDRGNDALFSFLPEGGKEQLEPIKDMPTPMDEIHPYANLVSVENTK